MGNLHDLAAYVRGLPDKIEQKNSNLAKQVVRAILTNLVNITPVDTSQALSNWQVSLNGPKTNVIPAYSEGSHGSTRGTSISDALSTMELALLQKKPGQTLWISNNLDYIMDLNNGSSRQAPAGFYERAILIGYKVISNGRYL